MDQVLFLEEDRTQQPIDTKVIWLNKVNGMHEARCIDHGRDLASVALSWKIIVTMSQIRASYFSNLWVDITVFEKALQLLVSGMQATCEKNLTDVEVGRAWNQFWRIYPHPVHRPDEPK